MGAGLAWNFVGTHGREVILSLKSICFHLVIFRKCYTANWFISKCTGWEQAGMVGIFSRTDRIGQNSFNSGLGRSQFLREWAELVRIPPEVDRIDLNSFWIGKCWLEFLREWAELVSSDRIPSGVDRIGQNSRSG